MIDFNMNSGKTLYFDHQASTPVCEEVIQEMMPHFRESFANPHSSSHVLGWSSAASVDKAAQQVASLIGANVDEIVFTSGATESNNLAIHGLARRAAIRGSSRKRLLLSAVEHKSVLSVGRAMAELYGYSVELIPVDRNGHIIAEELEQLLSEDVLLVSIMAVNNEIGSIQDITTISRIVRKTGAIFHCDAAQAPMATPMENFASLADMVSLSGHKMYGPKGVGALYICRNLQDDIEPIIYGGGQQNGIRPGTLPTPLCVGMGAAAQYILSPNASKLRDELRSRRKKLIDMLSALPWESQLYGDEGEKRHPGNISIGFQGFNADDVLGVLQPYLAASSGSACTSGIPEPSHVLKAIGLTSQQAESAIRFSLGFETSNEDIEKAADLIDRALQRLSSQRER